MIASVSIMMVVCLAAQTPTTQPTTRPTTQPTTKAVKAPIAKITDAELKSLRIEYIKSKNGELSEFGQMTKILLDRLYAVKTEGPKHWTVTEAGQVMKATETVFANSFTTGSGVYLDRYPAAAYMKYFEEWISSADTEREFLTRLSWYNQELMKFKAKYGGSPAQLKRAVVHQYFVAHPTVYRTVASKKALLGKIYPIYKAFGTEAELLEYLKDLRSDN